MYTSSNKSVSYCTNTPNLKEITNYKKQKTSENSNKHTSEECPTNCRDNFIKNKMLSMCVLTVVCCLLFISKSAFAVATVVRTATAALTVQSLVLV